MLPAKVVSPEYWAVIVCGPTARAEVWKVVTEESRKADCPRVVVPSLKVTCPVGTDKLPVVVKVAVKVTVVPNRGLFELAAKARDVGPWTATATAAEVLVAYVASPLYVAVTLCPPTPRLDVCKVAVPCALIAVDPMETTPSSNVTVPVGAGVPVAWATFAVKVTGLPKTMLPASDPSAVVVGVAPGVVTSMTITVEALLR